MRRAIGLALSLALIGVSPPARAGDPAAALEQLKKGYDLKTQGKCRNAIPHFVESQRLDPQPKTLLNLSDCEADVGGLVAEKTHATEAPPAARAQTRTEPLGPADERLAALEKRIPTL